MKIGIVIKIRQKEEIYRDWTRNQKKKCKEWKCRKYDRLQNNSEKIINTKAMNTCIPTHSYSGDPTMWCFLN